MIGLLGPVFCSLDELNREVIRAVMNGGAAADPRGLPTKELLGVSVRLANPRARIISSEVRKWSLALGLGEFFWHLAASKDLQRLAYYSSVWEQFSDDGRTISGSCYGFRIFGGAPSQWDRVIAELRRDRFSRRAFLYVGTPDVKPGTHDMACVTGAQLLLRDGALHMHLALRSSDVFRGLPYDVFVFSMLQEYAASILKCELGEFVLTAGSMHLYDSDAASALRWLSSSTPGARNCMRKIISPDQVVRAAVIEERLRNGESVAYPEDLDELVAPLKRFADARRGALAK